MARLVAALAAGTMLAFVSSAGAVGDRYEITPQEHLACDDDAVRLCAAAFPDQEALLACMKTNRKELTPVCRSALNAGLKRRGLSM